MSRRNQGEIAGVEVFRVMLRWVREFYGGVGAWPEEILVFEKSGKIVRFI